LLRARRDVILVYQAAFPVGLAAWMISRIRRIPYVLDVVDLWPESVASTGMLRNKAAQAIIRRLVKFIYDGAARISVVTEGFRRNLLHMGVPAAKLTVIQNWMPAETYERVPYDARLAEREGLAGNSTSCTREHRRTAGTRHGPRSGAAPPRSAVGAVRARRRRSDGRVWSPSPNATD
jgi:glycosyltransferase involved in cell wall biosynthesis